jgi:hypothetical protein
MTFLKQDSSQYIAIASYELDQYRTNASADVR